MCKLSLIFGAISLSFFVSCKKEVLERPDFPPKLISIIVNNVEFTNGDSSHFEAGDTVIVEVNIEDDFCLSKATLKSRIGGTNGKFVTVEEKTVSGPKSTARFVYTIPKAIGCNNSITLLFVAKDVKGSQVELGTHLLAIEPESSPYDIEFVGARIYNPFSSNFEHDGWDIISDKGVNFYNCSNGQMEVFISLSDKVLNWWPYQFASDIFGSSMSLRRADGAIDYDNVSERDCEQVFDSLLNIPATSSGYSHAEPGDVFIGKWISHECWDSLYYHNGNRYTVIKITKLELTTNYNNDDFVEFSYKKDLE